MLKGPCTPNTVHWFNERGRRTNWDRKKTGRQTHRDQADWQLFQGIQIKYPNHDVLGTVEWQSTALYRPASLYVGWDIFRMLCAFSSTRGRHFTSPVRRRSSPSRASINCICEVQDKNRMSGQFNIVNMLHIKFVLHSVDFPLREIYTTSNYHFHNCVCNLRIIGFQEC